MRVLRHVTRPICHDGRMTAHITTTQLGDVTVSAISVSAMDNNCYLLQSGGDQLLIDAADDAPAIDRKSTRLNSSHVAISYAVFCLKKKTCRRATVLYM